MLIFQLKLKVNLTFRIYIVLFYFLHLRFKKFVIMYKLILKYLIIVLIIIYQTYEYNFNETYKYENIENVQKLSLFKPGIFLIFYNFVT